MSSFRVGIDRRGDRFLVARIDTESGRVKVVSLGNIDTPPGVQPFWADGEPVALAVPDREVMVKQVRPGKGDLHSIEDRLSFELSQSVLDEETNFAFDFQSTGDEQRFLGIIFRREQLEQVRKDFGFCDGPRPEELSFQLRSVALGKGYLNFCRRQEGTLVCLVDLAGDTASICFIFGNEIVDVMSLPLGGSGLDMGQRYKRLAVDLKTVINFRQAVLMDAGISVPLSGLLVLGDQVDEECRQVIRSYFPIGAGRPVLNDGFFGQADAPDPETWPLYMVALGVTVN